MSYFLKVYDNFHYMEEDEVYYVKGISTAEEALKKAKALVESYSILPGISSVNYSIFSRGPLI